MPAAWRTVAVDLEQLGLPPNESNADSPPPVSMFGAEAASTYPSARTEESRWSPHADTVPNIMPGSSMRTQQPRRNR